MTKQETPAIRFNGFTNDWEQRKFENIVKRLSKTSNSNELPKVEFEDIVSAEGRLNKDISCKFDDRKGIKFNPENILYGKLRPYLKNYLFPDFEGIALGDFWVFEANNSVAIFNYYLLQSENYQKVANDTSGTKMPRSDWKKVSKTSFFIPNKHEEQTKIGNFFKQLDDTIALQERKLDLLKEQKKGFLQKMFPKKDEKVPEIRFKGFTDDWEQRKLGEGMKEYTDRVFIEDDKIYNQISVKNIGEITLRGQKIGSKIGRKRQAKINLSDNPTTLIFTRQTIEQGGIGFAPECTDGAIVTENMPTISVDTSVFDKQYLECLFDTVLFRKNVILPNIEGGTAQIAIHEDDVLDSDVIFPNFEEQQKIGSFFKQLDDTIALQEREVTELKAMKKSFLQKMFV